MFLPAFRSFLDKELHLSLFSNFQLLITLFVILIATGCIAGAYPGYLISAFQPVQILKGNVKTGLRSFLGLRNALVIIQFIISAILIVCAIGKGFGCNMIPKNQGRIIGVVEDFHYYPLHYEIQPLAIQLAAANSKNWLAQYLSVKVSSHDISGTLSFIKGKWHKFSAHPFNYQFVDSQLDAMYKTEHKLGQLFSLFAFIAILIACLGLYGLVTFSIKQKIKEIGIRKVLGATLSQIMNLLLRETALCIVIANLFAWPIAWYIMNKWLQDFAYRITIEWWIFLSSGILVLFIALITMSRLAIRAATTNPVNSLRYE